MEFYHKGKILVIEKNDFEQIDLFLKRGDFMVKNINNATNFEELEKFSFIFIYNKYYNCKYNKTIINKLNNRFTINI